MDERTPTPPTAPSEDAERERLETLIEEGREKELGEADYQKALEDGLIEG